MKEIRLSYTAAEINAALSAANTIGNIGNIGVQQKDTIVDAINSLASKINDNERLDEEQQAQINKNAEVNEKQSVEIKDSTNVADVADVNALFGNS